MSRVIEALGDWKDTCMRIPETEQEDLINALEVTNWAQDLLKALADLLQSKIRKI